MEEQFEDRPLISTERLRTLQSRSNSASAIRLVLHLGAFALTLFAIVVMHRQPLVAFALALLLAWIWSGLFAPFHECTHRTAFSSRRLNALGAWLTGIPFGMAPAVYRLFHFEHHRHTQDPERDPELLNPAYARWPDSPYGWWLTVSGYGLIRLKLTPQAGFAFHPEQWERYAPWARAAEMRPQLVFESRVLLALWTVFLLGCLLWLPGGWWILFAAWAAHVPQTLWIATEHTGLSHDGTIVARTRSIETNPFVRFWLWNMNYHTEHHAWPGIPWHQLPAAHAEVRDALENLAGGYAAVYRDAGSGGARGGVRA